MRGRFKARIEPRHSLRNYIYFKVLNNSQSLEERLRFPEICGGVFSTFKYTQEKIEKFLHRDVISREKTRSNRRVSAESTSRDIRAIYGLGSCVLTCQGFRRIKGLNRTSTQIFMRIDLRDFWIFAPIFILSGLRDIRYLVVGRR